MVLKYIWLEIESKYLKFEIVVILTSIYGIPNKSLTISILFFLVAKCNAV